jgi:hypothetical protein
MKQCQWFKTYTSYINNYSLSISCLAQCGQNEQFQRFMSVRSRLISLEALSC